MDEVEVGWLAIGRLDAVDRDAVVAARDRLLEVVREQLPAFAWKMPLLERADIAQPPREDPITLLEYGVAERDARHWDFVIVVTGADLIGRRKPYALATSSSAVAVATLSTAQVDPHARGELADGARRCEVMTRRLCALALHVLGDLAGVPHDEGAGHAMMQIRDVADLDELDGYSERSVRITEQIVMAHVSFGLTVIAGLLVAYAVLFALTWALAIALVPDSVVAAWSGTPETAAIRYARHAGFVAALGLVIGALGASFEHQSYFRHVAYVDEEI